MVEDDKEGVMAENTKMKCFLFFESFFFQIRCDWRSEDDSGGVHEGWGIEASVH